MALAFKWHREENGVAFAYGPVSKSEYWAMVGPNGGSARAAVLVGSPVRYVALGGNHASLRAAKAACENYEKASN